VRFDRLCVATGASPRAAVSHESVLTIRDTDSVATLNSRLSTARRVMVVGNGGIALEFVCVHPPPRVSALTHAFALPSQKPFACPATPGTAATQAQGLRRRTESRTKLVSLGVHPQKHAPSAP
jgi:hypothetical protein